MAMKDIGSSRVRNRLMRILEVQPWTRLQAGNWSESGCTLFAIASWVTLPWGKAD